MSTAETSPVAEHDRIKVAGNTLDVSAGHGPNWFPMHIEQGVFSTTLYLRRDELHALRCRLDEIDDGMPQPEVRP